MSVTVFDCSRDTDLSAERVCGVLPKRVLAAYKGLAEMRHEFFYWYVSNRQAD